MMDPRDRCRRRAALRLVLGVCLGVALTVGAASAATRPLSSLLLRVDEMPPGFRVATSARMVDPDRYEADVEVPLYLFGGPYRVAVVEFKRKVPRLDNSLDEVAIDVMKFRDPARAHTAYGALVRRASFTPFAVGRIGDERAGFGLTLAGVTVRNVYWRHRNVVVSLSGSYMAASERQPSARSLLAVAQVQQAKLARIVR